MTKISENETHAIILEGIVSGRIGSSGSVGSLTAGSAALRQLDQIDRDIDRCVVGEGEMPSAEQPTLRDQFAMAALAAIRPQNYETGTGWHQFVGEASYWVADAMLAARKDEVAE